MRISEVSERYDISPDTLRYYERVGLIPTVNRSESGFRDYDQTDVGWVEFIKYMRSAGLTIEVLTEYVELVQLGDHTSEARKQILIDQRDELVRKIEEMQKTLDILDYKIAVYEKALAEKENHLNRNESELLK